jgi:hypothetical protein
VGRPLTLKPAAPVTTAWLTFTLELPELIRVSETVWLLPTSRFPKLTLEGITLSCPGMAPAPVKGIVTVCGLLFPESRGEADDGLIRNEILVITDEVGLPFLLDATREALVVTDIVPLWFPLVFGVKVTLKFVLWLAGSVNGRFIPPTWNSFPLTATCEIVRSDPPELVSVAERVWLSPNVTLPKLMGEGFTLSWPAFTDCPVSETVIGADVVLEMASEPEGFPEF